MKIVPLLAAGLILWIATQSNAQAATRVYLMRGLFDVFSMGMAISEKLNKRGHLATVHMARRFGCMGGDCSTAKKTLRPLGTLPMIGRGSGGLGLRAAPTLKPSLALANRLPSRSE